MRREHKRRSPVQLLVFPVRETPGNRVAYEPLSWSDALLKSHTTDAHCALYGMPDEEAPCKRLNLNHLQELVDIGTEPLLYWLFADIDNPEHQRWSPEEAETLWSELVWTLPELEGAGFYSTRGGYRLIWRLAQPLPVSLAGDYIRQFNNYLLQGGIPIDQACIPQWNTLFRLPYVTREGEALSAYVEMEHIKPGLSWPPPVPLKREVRPSATSYAKYQRPEPEPVSPEQWSRLEGKGGILERWLPTLRKGAAIGRKGTRQTTMYKLAAAIIGHLKLDDPSEAYRFMAPSVAAWLTADAPTLDELWDRCNYLVSIDQAKRRSAVVVTEEIQKGQPPIVYRGSKYFVRSTGDETYVGPVDAVGLCQMLQQHYTTPGVVETTNDKGNPYAPAVYVQRYGRCAQQVLYKMGLGKSYYDPDNCYGTLTMGCCVGLEVEARYDETIAHWLQLFAGDYADKLLDWLATVTLLDQPTCGLYIHGAPGTGKGLIAAGVSALWGTGATSYNDAVGKFNSALTRNPIVHVDEDLSYFDGREGFSGAFRSLIGESTRQLRIKNQPSSTLIGSPRLIISANNADALQISESLSQSDLKAIAQRILYIEHDASPARYLEDLGGRAFTKNWVSMPDGKPGLLPQHIAHLVATREVSRGSRFLVEGEISAWHRDLMGASGLQGAVLAALAHYIQRQDYDDGIQVGGGEVCVNAPAIRRLWGSLTQDATPREMLTVKALKTLSNGKTVRRSTSSGRLRFYRISSEDILRTAENLQIGDTDIMREYIYKNPEQREYPYAVTS